MSKPIMPAPLHLIIPAATPLETGHLPAHLAALLRLLKPTQRIDCDDDCPAMPCELALARLNQLPDTPGFTPWAAFESGTMGEPCAWVNLSHWQIGMGAVTMTAPEALSLDEATTQQFMVAMAPYFAEDGITLAYWQPGVLLAKGETFRSLRCVSIERVVGQNIRDWQALGGTPEESKLRRLQNEMQMLLYTLPANDEREAKGLPPINSFWVTGAGVLDAAKPSAAGVQVETRLRLAGADPVARAKAWAEVDANACHRLADQVRSGMPASLTLCGDRAAQTFELVKQSFAQKIMNKFSHSSISGIISSL
jgi:hypothetical protein